MLDATCLLLLLGGDLISNPILRVTAAEFSFLLFTVWVTRIKEKKLINDLTERHSMWEKKNWQGHET